MSNTKRSIRMISVASAVLASSVASKDERGCEQKICYHNGVGTSRFERIRGGMFGLGLSKTIRDCYSFVVENFDEGDETFLFGFRLPQAVGVDWSARAPRP